MTDELQLLALRHRGRDFAVEAGRVYLLGGDATCDLRLDGVAGGVRARLWLQDGAIVLEAPGAGPAAAAGDGAAGGDGAAISVNGRAAADAPVLVAGDVIRVGPAEVRVVRDRGDAELLPIPSLVHERKQRVQRTAAAIASRGLAVEDATFAGLMAQELRRAPWLLLSMLAHAALLLVLLLLFPPRPQDGVRNTIFGFELPPGIEAPPAAPAAPQVQVEATPDALDPKLVEVAVEQAAAADAVPLPPDPGEGFDAAAMLASLRGNPTIGARRGGGNDVLAAGGGAGEGGFRETVTELRRTGLDIVFVFDSTGSMNRSIAATKAGIATMLDVLRALVPQSRFALVTYRDRGNDEEYVVRTLPLGDDFYGACNFVNSVEAGGGGDWPEAVLAGLRAAFRQPFQSGARRVVVLAGDAPPHPEEERALLEEVRAFAKNGTSFVHTLFTGGGRSARADEAREVFGRIAAKGRGVATDVGDPDAVLQHVLTLAFGRQFEGNLAAVQQLVASRQPPLQTWALDLARRGGDELVQTMRTNAPTPEALVQALLHTPRRRTARALVDVLAASDTPAPARQVAGHALQRLLALPAPPIVAEEPRPLRSDEAERLRRHVDARLPD